jgi:hypothetical protein
MNPNFEDILNTLPEKPPRSHLEPYRELIDELRRRERTYREIAQILAEKCQLHVAASTIHDFVRIRSRKTRKPAKSQPIAGPRVALEGAAPESLGLNAARKKEQPIEGVRQRIAALKVRAVQAEPSPHRFQYDPRKPLKLSAKTRKV